MLYDSSYCVLSITDRYFQRANHFSFYLSYQDYELLKLTTLALIPYLTDLFTCIH